MGGVRPPEVHAQNLNQARVKLISSIRVPPCKSAVVPVRVQGSTIGAVILEPLRKTSSPLEVAESLLDINEDGVAHLVISNPTFVTRVMWRGTAVGTVVEANIVDPSELLSCDEQPLEEDGDAQVSKVASGPISSAERIQ